MFLVLLHFASSAQLLPLPHCLRSARSNGTGKASSKTAAVSVIVIINTQRQKAQALSCWTLLVNPVPLGSYFPSESAMWLQVSTVDSRIEICRYLLA